MRPAVHNGRPHGRPPPRAAERLRVVSSTGEDSAGAPTGITCDVWCSGDREGLISRSRSRLMRLPSLATPPIDADCLLVVGEVRSQAAVVHLPLSPRIDRASCCAVAIVGRGQCSAVAAGVAVQRRARCAGCRVRVHRRQPRRTGRGLRFRAPAHANRARAEHPTSSCHGRSCVDCTGICPRSQVARRRGCGDEWDAPARRSSFRGSRPHLREARSAAHRLPVRRRCADRPPRQR